MAAAPFAHTFPSGTVEYHLATSVKKLRELAPTESSIVVTDENISRLHGAHFKGYKTLIVPPGEDAKSVETVQRLAQELTTLEAHRKTMLVGVGGGVVCDLAGFLSSVYMRGMPVGLVPTTLLAAVDASIGGKNGVNLGLHKNLLGTVCQPRFILQDTDMLDTLPDAEWSNGFAEVIKYGCISDIRIFNTLSHSDITFYKKTRQALDELIAGCVDVKNKIVNADEDETGLRRILNFGHTAGHAFERLHNLPHGAAVGLGMLVACLVSEKVAGLDPGAKDKLANTLAAYGLPTSLDYNPEEVAALLRADKKRTDDGVNYVVMEAFGKVRVENLQFSVIEDALKTFADAGGH
jgi:3-dehydroquinate synthase